MRSTLIALLFVAATVLVTPVARPQTLPLGGITLIAEKSIPAAEVAVTAKNGNQNGNPARAPIHAVRDGAHVLRGEVRVALHHRQALPAA